MSIASFRYTFDKKVDLREVESTLVLSMLATEALHGTSEVRLNGRYKFEPKHRTCVIDARSAIGQDLNRLFIGFLTQEFGGASFTIERLPSATSKESAA